MSILVSVVLFKIVSTELTVCVQFKALEAMAEQVKPEGPYAPAVANASGSKLEKNGSKSRGSGSPFKCIGLGLVQQIKSERDEELTAGRLRIEELEALAASRQKEVGLVHRYVSAYAFEIHDVHNFSV